MKKALAQRKSGAIPRGVKYLVVIGILRVALGRGSHLQIWRGAMILTDINAVKNIVLNVNNVCPASTQINKVNDHQPYSELMGLGEVQSVLNYWYGFNCAKGSNKNSCNFDSIGQHLLHHAIQRNQTLLTVQVGAMDGKKQ